MQNVPLRLTITECGSKFHPIGRQALVSHYVDFAPENRNSQTKFSKILMEGIKDRISWCIDQIKPMARLEEELGVAQSTIYSWKSNTTGRMPPIESAFKLARMAGKTLDWLVSGEDGETGEWVSIPVYSGKVAGGYGTEDESRKIYEHKYRRVFVRGRKLHKTWVVGNSMDAGLSISDGDMILVDETDKTLRDGKPFVFATENGFIVKEVAVLPDGILLKSRNPDFEPIKIKKEDMHQIQVIGRVREVQKIL